MAEGARCRSREPAAGAGAGPATQFMHQSRSPLGAVTTSTLRLPLLGPLGRACRRAAAESAVLFCTGIGFPPLGGWSEARDMVAS